MNSISPIGFRDLDDLRMIGLSRVPRCAGCPRFRVLALAVEKRSPSPAPLPAAPRSCNHRICQPLVTRFSHGGDRMRTATVRRRTAGNPT